MSDSSHNRKSGTNRRAMPAFWQLALVGVSVLLMVAGLGFGFVGSTGSSADSSAMTRADERTGAGSGNGLATGFLPGGPSLPGGTGQPMPRSDEDESAHAPEASSAGDLLSPALFKLGFGFFIGFSMAYAVRTFMKVSLVAAGFFAMLLFGLQYAGIIDVNWNVMAERYDSVASWIGAQTESFAAFVSGTLPGVGAAAAGAVVGVRRS